LYNNVFNVNLSDYVGHVTIFIRIFIFCVLFSSRVRFRCLGW